jgi:hypothetical protein
MSGPVSKKRVRDLPLFQAIHKIGKIHFFPLHVFHLLSNLSLLYSNFNPRRRPNCHILAQSRRFHRTVYLPPLFSDMSFYRVSRLFHFSSSEELMTTATEPALCTSAPETGFNTPTMAR